jgi:hypothetical protein
VRVGPSSIQSTRFPFTADPSPSTLTMLRVRSGRVRVEPAGVLGHGLHTLRGRGLRLVDDHHVGSPQVHLARKVGVLVADPERIGDGHPHVGAVERPVVVAAVPEHHVRLCRGLGQDRRVVDAGVDDGALVNVGFVLLPLLEGAGVLLEVFVGGEALDRLPGQVAVRHGVTDDDRPPPGFSQRPHHVPRGWALAAPGPNRGDGDHRNRRLEHGLANAQQPHVGAGGDRSGRHVANVLVADVGIGEHHLVDRQVAYQRLQIVLGVYGEPLRVEGSRQRRRISPAVDARNLGGGEADDLVARIVAIHHVEIVEVASGRTQDQHASSFHECLPKRESVDDSKRVYRPTGLWCVEIVRCGRRVVPPSEVHRERDVGQQPIRRASPPTISITWQSLQCRTNLPWVAGSNWSIKPG